MSNDRVSRTQESRAAEVQEEIAYDFADTSLLSTKNMPPREGFVQRWVRTTIGNEDDQSNLYRSLNQGWMPRKANTVPRGTAVPTTKYEGADVIGIRGTILMERPIEIHEREVAFEKQNTQNQMASVTQNMHNVHVAGSGVTRPEFTEHKSRVSKGRVAPVAPDD